MFQRPNEALSWVLVPKHSAQKSDKASSSFVKCNFCNGDFTEAELSLHERQEHQEEIKVKLSEDENTFCSCCLKSFSSRDEMIKHTLSVHLHSSEAALRVEQEIFTCAHCNQVFFTKLHLVNHILFTHSGLSVIKSNKKIECHFCGKKMPIRYYVQHATTQLSKNHMNHCFKCNMKCKSQAALREHIRMHSKYYYCDICQNSFNSEPAFNLHIKYHRNLVNHIEEVDVSKYFISRSAAVDCWKLRKSLYFSGVWLPINFNICILCREICYTHTEMCAHVATHKPRENAKQVYVCECGEKFSSKILLKQHNFQFKGSHNQETVRQANQTALEKMDFTEGVTPIVLSGASLTRIPQDDADTEPVVASSSDNLEVYPTEDSSAQSVKTTNVPTRSRTRMRKRKSLQNVAADLEIIPQFCAEVQEAESDTSQEELGKQLSHDLPDDDVVVFVIQD